MPKQRKGKKSIAHKVRSNAYKIGKIVKNIERKHYTNALSVQDVNTTGFIQYIPTIPQNDTVSGRSGSQVTARTLTIKAYLHNDHGTPVDGIARFMVVQVKQINNVAQTWASIVGGGANVNGFIAWENKENVRVLYDNSFTFDTAVYSNIPFKVRSTRLGSRTAYNGANGTEAECLSNAYYILGMSTVAGTTNCPQLEIDWRITYDDL